jgi:hypothetical protein|nr:MAG TPA: hypothetical protein [Caudoviricetes sp.]
MQQFMSDTNNSSASNGHPQINRSNSKSAMITGFLLAIATFLTVFYFHQTYITTIKSNITTVPWNNKKINITQEYPSWFYIYQDSISTLKRISDKEKNILYNIISKEDSCYHEYKLQIDKLAFNSNANTNNTSHFFILITLVSVIGCLVRSNYDFIGHICYKKDLDMKIWWAWYVMRPFIAICLSAFIFIACDSQIFSLDLIRDNKFNTTLILSFITGFSLQDMITLLRKASKHIFKAGES